MKAEPTSIRYPLSILLLSGGWLLLGLLVAPPLLEATYHSGQPAFLQPIFSAAPLDFFLNQVFGITIAGCLALWAFAGFAWLLRSPATANRLVGEATPGALGAIRMLVCGVLLISTLWEDLPSTAALPRAMIRPMGLIQLFYFVPGFETFTGSATALTVFKAALVVVLFLALVGWKTRWVLPLGAFGYFLLAGLMRQYAWFYHTGLLALYLAVVLSMVPAGDGWSVDRLIKLWRGERVPPADVSTRRYGWARYALWTVFALPYVAAGLSKLRNGGLFWWDAVNFKYILFHSTLRPMEFDFKVSLLLTSAPDIVFEMLALSALLGEVLYGLVLFSRRARWILPTVMLVMHIGILFMQNILFFDLILLQFIFFNLRPLRQAVGRRLAARWERVQLLYDNTWPRQVRAVRVLHALDLFGRLDITALENARGQEGWSMEYQGHAIHGAKRYRLLARSLPALWCFLPMLYIPGFSARLDRYVLGRKEAPAGALSPARMLPPPLGSPRLVLALTAVLLVCWVFRIELYPFTGMQMFSKRNGPVVTYELAWAALRSGEVVRAPIEASIGAMADSRYRRVLEMAFDPKRADLTEAFVQAFVQQWNRHARPEQQIIAVEIQRWRWNFLEEPEHPAYGRLVGTKVYPSGSAAYTLD